MLLGSALPRKACSSLQRRRLHVHLLRPAPIAPRHANARRLGHGGFSRAQSTGTDAADPHGQPSPPSPLSNGSSADAPSSFIDRLSKLPVRRHGALDSVVVKPIDTQLTPRERHLSLRKNLNALLQQTRIEGHWRQQNHSGDWRVILDLLTKLTPTIEKAEDDLLVKVILPPEAVDFFLSDHHYNLWNIKKRSRCKMEVYRPAGVAAAAAEHGDKDEVKGGSGNHAERDKQPDTDSYIILRGRRPVINDALTELLKVTDKATVLNLQKSGNRKWWTDGLTGEPVPPGSTRIPIDDYKMSVPPEPYTLTMRADEIPRPRQWTVEAFEQYVVALVMGRVEPGLGQKLYSNIGEDCHQAVVVAQLRAAFDDPDAAAAVSSSAFFAALRYLTWNGETNLGHARALFERVRQLGLPMDAEVYNLLAETAARSKNLFAFKTTLDLLTAHNVKPNKRTWLLFLRTVEAEEVKRYILHAMDSKGFFLEQGVAKSLSSEMADQDIYRAIQLGQDMDTFLAGLQELYGPDWKLTLRACTRYLHRLGQHGKFEDAKRLLERMFSPRHPSPDARSLSTILAHCKTQRKIDLAIDFIRMFEERRALVLTEKIIHSLVELARNTFKPHVFSAIWRYAHLAGLMSSSTRRRGLELLSSGPDGALEVLRLTSRLRPLWEAPVNCRITRQHFVTHLLLCDYQKAVGDPGRIKIDVEIDGPWKPSEEPWQSPLEEQYMRAASVVRVEQQDLRKSTEESRPPPGKGQYPRFAVIPSKGGNKRAEDENPDWETPVQKLYEPFAQWVHERGQQYQPNIRLSTFLQAALDRDRSLHKLAWEGAGVVQHGVPVDLLPVELPVRRAVRRDRSVNRMLKFEERQGMAEDGNGTLLNPEQPEVHGRGATHEKQECSGPAPGAI